MLDGGAGVRQQRKGSATAVGRGQPAEGDGRLVPTTLRLVPRPIGSVVLDVLKGMKSSNSLTRPEKRVAGSGLHAVFDVLHVTGRQRSGSPVGAARLGRYLLTWTALQAARPRCWIGDYLQSE